MSSPSETPPDRDSPASAPDAALVLRGESALVKPEPPVQTEVTVGRVPKVAGGLPAILDTVRHAVGKMGPVRAVRALLQLNQKGGFDCQSCAWPDSDEHRDLVAFCENGAKAVADEGMRKTLGADFFATHSVAALSEQSDFWLNAQGRLTEPLVRREGATHYTPIGWDEALRLIASELNALASPDEAVFYTSGRASNEAAFVYQLFVRQFGTNNLPDCSNMCHESSGSALSESIGIGKGTVTLADFDSAQLILIMGQNPGTNHPRMMTALQRAKRRGAKIISMNPLPEAGLRRFKHPQEVFDTLVGPGTQLTDLFLQVRINSDMELLQGLMKRLLELEDERPGKVLDQRFILTRTGGFDELAQHLRALSWDAIVERTGITRAQIHEAAEHLASAERIIACWAMGLTQHRNSVGTIQDVANLLLMRGAVGKTGAGLCPVRGHSNVQGDRTVGVWERPGPTFLDALDKEFNFKAPRNPGLDTVDSLRALHEGKAKVFFGLGGNFLSATPDTQFTAKALTRARLTAHVSTKLNRAHLVGGTVALILPCLGRSEIDSQASGPQQVSTENSMGVVQSSEGRIKPASPHLRSEVSIVCSLARATLGDRATVKWEELSANYDRIREHIEHVVPGFEQYNVRVRNPGGFYLPNLPRQGVFPTPSGLAQFVVHAFPSHSLQPGQLLLMTIRSHDQFNTTIYGLDDRYRGIYGGRRVVFLNPEDVRELGLSQGQQVDLTSHFHGQHRRAERFVVVPFSIPRQCAAAYFPEANVLVPVDSVAEKSNTPVSKSIVITLAPSAPPLQNGLGTKNAG